MFVRVIDTGAEYRVMQAITGSADGNTVTIKVEQMGTGLFWDFSLQTFQETEVLGEMDHYKTWSGGSLWQETFTPDLDENYLVTIIDTTLDPTEEYTLMLVSVSAEPAYISAVSQTKICNVALRLLGAARIISINEDSEQARVLRDVYDIMLEETLAGHPWNFSLKRASLAQLAAAPPYEYAYTFALPTDCLRIIETEDGIEYQQEGKKLLTNESSVNIRYISRSKDPTTYSPAFISCFTARLCAEIAFPLTGDAAIATSKKQDYVMKLAAARSHDGQVGSPRKKESSSWLTSR